MLVLLMYVFYVLLIFYRGLLMSNKILTVTELFFGHGQFLFNVRRRGKEPRLFLKGVL
jgi:hypothetical protein